jgi:Mrp family chromosome partitioning ATPase
MAGVTDYLLGDAVIDDILVPVSAYPDLVFINAGLGHSNPSELIEVQKLDRMFGVLESQFDIIVVDAAPAVLVSDAHMLSSYCDTTLYVIRHGYTPKSFLKRFDMLNTATPLKNTYMVFNGIKPRGYLKGIYGYGYGYIYGNNGSKNISGKALRIAG